MKYIRLTALALLLVLPAAVFAIDIAASDAARLDITSRTSFGIDLDNPYRYGLANELTQFDLVFGLAPYQKITNRLYSDQAVGFINITLFNLDLVKVGGDGIGFHQPTVNGGDPMGTNRYQTGEFLAGIAKDPWLIQTNAGGNEPFGSPWNKGLDFINDGFKFSWAYVDSMVDIRRVKTITDVPVFTRRGEENMFGAGDIGPEAGYTMNQFTIDTVPHIGDRFAPDTSGQMIAVMYNTDTFGINTKLGTQKTFWNDTITKDDMNGLALGIDSVFTPSAVSGLKVFASLMGTTNWGKDTNPDPIWGGTRVGYNIPLGEDGDISVEPWAGFDMRIAIEDDGNVQDPGYEASVGLTMRWPGFAGWGKDYIINSDGRVFPGMSLGYLIFEDLALESSPGILHNLRFTLFEPRGDEGLFYHLGSEIIIDLADLSDIGSGTTLLATAYFDWELSNLVGKVPGMLIPWTILYYDNYPKVSGSDERINNIKFDFGINLENAIPNTTFGFVWNTGGLIEKNTYGYYPNIADEHQLGYVRLFVEIRL